MIRPKLKISPDLYHRLKKASERLGYSSVNEFASHILEKAVEQAEEADSEEEVRRRLQGLGYLG